MKKRNVDLSVVVPFYNESGSVDKFFNVIVPILRSTKTLFEILCINDGSKDNTLDLLIGQKSKHKEIKIINFSRNFGKEAALTAGLDFAEGNCVIPIDSDLQDPPELILDMLKKWESGFDMVLAKRVDRKSDTVIKRMTANLFYKIYNLLSDLKIPENVGDFRLIDRKVVDILKTFPERKRFMKGLFAFAGFKIAVVEYTRLERDIGQSKWSYIKLWNYAIDGITAFSTFPLRISIYLGAIITFFAFIYGLRVFFKTVYFGVDVPGYASTMVAILFFGGVQLISLGIIGEYVGRIYSESKKRPIYIVRDII